MNAVEIHVGLSDDALKIKVYFGPVCQNTWAHGLLSIGTPLTIQVHNGHSSLSVFRYLLENTQ